MGKNNNEAEMREMLGCVYGTLEEIKSFARHLSDINVRRKFCSKVCFAKKVIDIALAKPPRNCDVGTAGEQAKRLNKWCNGRHCVNCQFKGGWPDECKLRWAQMPYAIRGRR